MRSQACPVRRRPASSTCDSVYRPLKTRGTADRCHECFRPKRTAARHTCASWCEGCVCVHFEPSGAGLARPTRATCSPTRCPRTITDVQAGHTRGYTSERSGRRTQASVSECIRKYSARGPAGRRLCKVGTGLQKRIEARVGVFYATSAWTELRLEGRLHPGPNRVKAHFEGDTARRSGVRTSCRGHRDILEGLPARTHANMAGHGHRRLWEHRWKCGWRWDGAAALTVRTAATRDSLFALGL